MDDTGQTAYLTIRHALLLCFLVIGIQLVLDMLFGSAIEGFAPDARAIAIFLVSLVSLNAVLYLASRKDGRLVSRLDFRQVKSLRLSLLLPIAVVAAGCAVVNGIFDKLLSDNIASVAQMNREMSAQMGDNLLIIFVFAVLINPIFEESFFRGFLVVGLARNYGRWNAMIMVAALFGAIHVNPTQIVSAFAFGLFLNWLMLSTAKLYYTIIAHSLYNASALLQGSFLADPLVSPKLQLFRLGKTGIDVIDCFGIVALFLGLIWCIVIVQKGNKARGLGASKPR